MIINANARLNVVTAMCVGLLIAVAASACVQHQDAEREPTRVDSPRTAARSDSLPIRRLEASSAAVYRNSSGIRDTTFTTIRDAVGWQRTWRRLSAQHSPVHSAPPIDFQKEMALVATLGEQRTGGYAITIETAIDRGVYLEAHVSRRAPGRGCGVAGTVTTPADVAIVPRREVEVRVVAHDHIMECGAR